jgi:hypothetical protein
MRKGAQATDSFQMTCPLFPSGALQAKSDGNHKRAGWANDRRNDKSVIACNTQKYLTHPR